MATGTRLRRGTIYGTLSDGLLTNSGAAVTMNSGGLASAFVPGVTAPQYMPVILDPQQQFGAPEIVWVTAHTVSTTTATVLRAQEGSTLRAHQSSEFWVAGPTPMDMFPWNWTSYTPAWNAVTAPTSIGNGTLTGSYLLYGTTCFLNIYLLMNTTSTGGSGAWSFGLPPGVAPAAGFNQNLVCEGTTTGGGAAVWSGFANLNPGIPTVITPFLSVSTGTSNIQQVQDTDASGAAGHGIPFTGANYPFVTGSNLVISGVFQTA